MSDIDHLPWATQVHDLERRLLNNVAAFDVERADLIAEATAVNTAAVELAKQIIRLNDQVAAQAQEIARLRTALEHYADESRWTAHDEWSPLNHWLGLADSADANDGPTVAAAALAGDSGKESE